MVQARWGHINRDVSMLTQVQALMLDGHHLVENRARFGGRAALQLLAAPAASGATRRSRPPAAGSTTRSPRTSTSPTAPSSPAGSFVYRENVVTPAELPEDISAFRAQQFRWAKGTVQTARKLMRRVLSCAAHAPRSGSRRSST